MTEKFIHFTKQTTTLKGFSVTKDGQIAPLDNLMVFDTVKSMETAKKLLADANGIDKTLVVPTEIERAEKHYKIPLEIFLEFAEETDPQRVRKAKEE